MAWAIAGSCIISALFYLFIIIVVIVVIINL